MCAYSTVEHQSSSVDASPPPSPNFRSILRSSRGIAAILMVKSRTAEQHRPLLIAGLHRCVRARNHKQQHQHVQSYFHFLWRNRSPAILLLPRWRCLPFHARRSSSSVCECCCRALTAKSTGSIPPSGRICSVPSARRTRLHGRRVQQ